MIKQMNCLVPESLGNSDYADCSWILQGPRRGSRCIVAYIPSFVSPRLAQRYWLYWAEALLLWVISLPWPLTRVPRRKEPPPPKRTHQDPKAIYMPADYLTGPVPATTFCSCGRTPLCCLMLLLSWVYPAMDSLDSNFCIINPIVGNEHYDVASGVQKILLLLLLSC